jgi:nucleoside 2-deoxyribosyltransferase
MEIHCKICGIFCCGSPEFDYLIPQHNRSNIDIFKYSAVIRELYEKSKKYGNAIYVHRGEVIENEKYTSLNLDKIDEIFPQDHDDLIDRVLILLDKKTDSFFENIKLDTNVDFPMFFSKDATHMNYTIDHLDRLGLLKRGPGPLNKINISIEKSGLERIREAKQKASHSNKIFVAMSFNEEHNFVFDDYIKPAVELVDPEFSAIRVDQPDIQDPHQSTINELIEDEIRGSRMMIADFTGNKAGVYWEAGYAEGLGKSVIFTTQDIEKDKPHFDINHRPILEHSPEKIEKNLFIRKLAARIKARIYS